jgi:hypothetical protein
MLQASNAVGCVLWRDVDRHFGKLLETRNLYVSTRIIPAMRAMGRFRQLLFVENELVQLLGGVMHENARISQSSPCELLPLAS